MEKAWKFLKLFGRVIGDGIAGILGVLLYFALVISPAVIFYENGDFASWWIVGVMFFTIFFVITLASYDEQDKELPRLLRFKISLFHLLYWTPIVLVFVLYLGFLFGRD